MHDHYTLRADKPASAKNDFSGFPVPNFTQVPNNWFDEILPTIPTRSACMVMNVIFRQTFGWHKEWDRISITQLMKKTMLTRQSVINAIKYLSARNLIFKHVEGRNGEQQTWYKLNIDANDFSSENDANSNNFDQSNYETPPSLKVRPTKETTQNIYKEKEDGARQKPPVHLFSKKENLHQKQVGPPRTLASLSPTSASPPRQKEKPPSKLDNRTSISKSLELTEAQEKELIARMGSREILKKYVDKRQAHLKKCPKSRYHKLTAYATISEWFTQDEQEKANRNKSAPERKEQKIAEGRMTVIKFVGAHSKYTRNWRIEKNYVIVSSSPTAGDIMINYDDPGLDVKLDERLDKEIKYARYLNGRS